MRKFSLLLFTAFLILLACQNKSNKNKQEASVMYEATELAVLMLQMHDESALWKEAILKDSFAITFPMDFYGIYTLEATDSAVRTTQFKALADIYINSLEDLVGTKKNKKQIKKYNTTISACISCHSVFCQLPIDKIKKLYISE